MLTHDVDFTQSMNNAVDYAEYEESGLVGTYFIQVKYIRDYNDDIFFNDERCVTWRVLPSLDGGREVIRSRIRRCSTSFPWGLVVNLSSYAPFVKSRRTAFNASLLGELRSGSSSIISPDRTSSRSGRGIVESIQAASSTAGNRVSVQFNCRRITRSPTLPYQLTYDRLTESEVDVFEFPVTIEDEELPKLGDRLPQALELARKLSRYGGSMVVLIHPNVLDHKLAFEKGSWKACVLLPGLVRWEGSGRWWAARDQVQLDVVRESTELRVTLTAPSPVSGLTLEVPNGWELARSGSSVQGGATGNDRDRPRVAGHPHRPIDAACHDSRRPSRVTGRSSYLSCVRTGGQSPKRHGARGGFLGRAHLWRGWRHSAGPSSRVTAP